MESVKCSTCLGLLFCLLAVKMRRISGTTSKEGESFGRLCGFTRYPDLCRRTLQGLAHHDHGPDRMHEGFVSALVEKARQDMEVHVADLSKLSHRIAGVDGHTALGHCNELMNMSLKRLNQSLVALTTPPRKSKEDIQAWLSAVLTFQEACKDSVKDDHFGPTVNLTSSKADYLSKLVSNALALANRITNHSQENYPPSSSNDFFPRWFTIKDRRLLQTTGIDANAVVAQDGTGDCRTVSEAIDAASGGRFVIYVKAGVYKENINTNKDGIMLVGDGKYSTIITGSKSVVAGFGLIESATFAVSGDGFIARDIGFHNSAGPYKGQAVALWISSDRSVLYRCSIAGYQDTLYAVALRQFYRECDIHGTIDFIFGNAAAVFQTCNLVLRQPQFGAYNVILANGRSDPGQATGLSIHKCKIMADSGLSSSVKSYLGRPWKEFSRSVIMQSSIGSVIAPRGWIEWEGNFGLKTLYFAEYLNSGPGAGTSGRVKWAGYHVIGSEDEALEFTVGRFIAGSSWLPSTGAAFENGLS